MEHESEIETGTPEQIHLVERLVVAIAAWTVVGLLVVGLVAVAEHLPLIGRLPQAVLDRLSGSTSISLALAGWGLGVVAIGVTVAVRHTMRKPVVLPWTDHLFVRHH